MLIKQLEFQSSIIPHSLLELLHKKFCISIYPFELTSQYPDRNHKILNLQKSKKQTTNHNQEQKPAVRLSPLLTYNEYLLNRSQPIRHIVTERMIL